MDNATQTGSKTMTNLEIASEVVRAATGKSVALAIVDRGFDGIHPINYDEMSD